jgi:hypothetical protein
MAGFLKEKSQNEFLRGMFAPEFLHLWPQTAESSGNSYWGPMCEREEKGGGAGEGAQRLAATSLPWRECLHPYFL